MSVAKRGEWVRNATACWSRERASNCQRAFDYAFFFQFQFPLLGRYFCLLRRLKFHIPVCQSQQLDFKLARQFVAFIPARPLFSVEERHDFSMSWARGMLLFLIMIRTQSFHKTFKGLVGHGIFIVIYSYGSVAQFFFPFFSKERLRLFEEDGKDDFWKERLVWLL